MKALKYLLIAAIVGAGLTATAAHAADQAAPAPQERKQGAGRNGGDMLARIDQAVGGLTAEQKTKIQEIIANYGPKLREAQGPDRRTVMQAQRDEIRAVLTPEQQKKFDAMPQRGPGGNRGKGKKAQQEE